MATVARGKAAHTTNAMIEDFPLQLEGYHGLSWISHSERLWLIDHLPALGTMVEIGSANGATAAAIADVRPLAEILCVDNFCGFDKDHLGDGQTLKANWMANKRPNMKLFTALTDILVKDVQLVFVDGNHSEDDTYTNLLWADGVLNHEGWIAVHDAFGVSWEVDVMKAVERFVEEFFYEKSEFVNTMLPLRRMDYDG